MMVKVCCCVSCMREVVIIAARMRKVRKRARRIQKGAVARRNIPSQPAIIRATNRAVRTFWQRRTSRSRRPEVLRRVASRLCTSPPVEGGRGRGSSHGRSEKEKDSRQTGGREYVGRVCATGGSPSPPAFRRRQRARRTPTRNAEKARTASRPGRGREKREEKSRQQFTGARHAVHASHAEARRQQRWGRYGATPVDGAAPVKAGN